MSLMRPVGMCNFAAFRRAFRKFLSLSNTEVGGVRRLSAISALSWKRVQFAFEKFTKVFLSDRIFPVVIAISMIMGRWSKPSEAATVQFACCSRLPLARLISGDEREFTVTRVSRLAFKTTKVERSIWSEMERPRASSVPEVCHDDEWALKSPSSKASSKVRRCSRERARTLDHSLIREEHNS